MHNLSSTGAEEGGGLGREIGGGGGCCGGGYVSFQRLPIHQGSAYRCAGPTSSAEENKARQQSSLSTAITHPSAGCELRVTFFPEPLQQLPLLLACSWALKTIKTQVTVVSSADKNLSLIHQFFLYISICVVMGVGGEGGVHLILTVFQPLPVRL